MQFLGWRGVFNLHLPLKRAEYLLGSQITNQHTKQKKIKPPNLFSHFFISTSEAPSVPADEGPFCRTMAGRFSSWLTLAVAGRGDVSECDSGGRANRGPCAKSLHYPAESTR